MPNKHHYVPKFYLKRFSESGKSIGLLNIPQHLLIDRSNLNNQCYKDYFYGKDLNFEQALSRMEGEFSGLLRKIDSLRSLPHPMTGEHVTLLYCLLIQIGRTKYAADAFEESNDQMVRQVFRENIRAEMGVDIDQFFIGVRDPAKYSTSLHLQFYPIMIDLNYKLLLNKTKKDFITSDVPVAKINPFLSFLKLGSQTGLGCKGLLIFYPISPESTVVLFDSEVYRVGNDNRQTIVIDSERDIEQLNLLQAAGCYENVYFRNNNFGCKELIKRATPHRREKKSNLRVFSQKNRANGRTSDILMTFAEDIRFSPALTFLSIRKTAKKWREKTKKSKTRSSPFIRSEELMREHELFTEELKSGRYHAHEFFQFLQDNHRGAQPSQQFQGATD